MAEIGGEIKEATPAIEGGGGGGGGGGGEERKLLCEMMSISLHFMWPRYSSKRAKIIARIYLASRVSTLPLYQE